MLRCRTPLWAAFSCFLSSRGTHEEQPQQTLGSSHPPIQLMLPPLAALLSGGCPCHQGTAPPKGSPHPGAPWGQWLDDAGMPFSWGQLCRVIQPHWTCRSSLWVSFSHGRSCLPLSLPSKHLLRARSKSLLHRTLGSPASAHQPLIVCCLCPSNHSPLV